MKAFVRKFSYHEEILKFKDWNINIVSILLKINGEIITTDPFKKYGNKLLLIQPNLKYRAYTDNELEIKSVEEAFAFSVIFGFEIIESNSGSY